MRSPDFENKNRSTFPSNEELVTSTFPGFDISKPNLMDSLGSSRPLQTAPWSPEILLYPMLPCVDLVSSAFEVKYQPSDEEDGLELRPTKIQSPLLVAAISTAVALGEGISMSPAHPLEEKYIIQGPAL